MKINSKNSCLIRICNCCGRIIIYKTKDSYNHSVKRYSSVSCVFCNRRRIRYWLGKQGNEIPWNGRKTSEKTKELLRNKIPYNKYSIDDFILKAKEIHKEKYDYSKSNYINSHIKIEIICPKHGSFWQIPTSHLLGSGCSRCGRDISCLKFKLTTDEFKEKANEIHNNTYDYSKSVYINNHTKLIIVCPVHGEFLQIPMGHLSGQGCNKCNGGVKYSLHKFIELSNKIHKNKYEYDNIIYINGRTQIKIKCKIHGYFIQFPSDHLR